MRKDIIVPEGWNNWDNEVVRWIRVVDIVVFAKDLYEFVYYCAVLRQYLLFRTRILLVVVMACRIPRPDDEVNRVFQILIYPSKSLIDQTERSIAVG